MRSTKTVSKITPYIIKAAFEETICALVRKRQSIMSRPTLNAIPDSTARGIIAVRSLIHNRTTNKTATRDNPDNADRPPDWILTTVPIVAPAPGIPPKKPDAIFPIPCPISSLFASDSRFVMLSAMTEVRRASIDPSIARTNALAIMICQCLMSNTGN